MKKFILTATIAVFASVMFFSCDSNSKEEIPTIVIDWGEPRNVGDNRIMSEYLSGNETKKDSAIEAAKDTYINPSKPSWETSKNAIQVFQKAWGDDSTVKYVLENGFVALIEMWKFHKENLVYQKMMRYILNEKPCNTVRWVMICSPDTAVHILKSSNNPAFLEDALDLITWYGKEHFSKELIESTFDLMPTNLVDGNEDVVTDFTDYFAKKGQKRLRKALKVLHSWTLWEKFTRDTVITKTLLIEQLQNRPLSDLTKCEFNCSGDWWEYCEKIASTIYQIMIAKVKSKDDYVLLAEYLSKHSTGHLELLRKVTNIK